MARGHVSHMIGHTHYGRGLAWCHWAGDVGKFNYQDYNWICDICRIDLISGNYFPKTARPHKKYLKK